MPLTVLSCRSSRPLCSLLECLLVAPPPKWVEAIVGDEGQEGADQLVAKHAPLPQEQERKEQ